MDKIRYLFRDIVYKFRIICRNVRQIKHIIHWIPVIYRDYDWDYAYIYRIWLFKLKNVRKNHEFEYDGLDRAIEILDFLQENTDRWMWADEQARKESDDPSKELVEFYAKKYVETKNELFQIVNDNIESWWD